LPGDLLENGAAAVCAEKQRDREIHREERNMKKMRAQGKP
jgi:hypothetical protein